MNEREKLLGQVRMYDFALVDAGLFLDGHPKNAAALAYFAKQKKLYDDAKATYEKKFGPLMFKDSEDTTQWNWVSDPWPWEGADN